MLLKPIAIVHAVTVSTFARILATMVNMLIAR